MEKDALVALNTRIKRRLQIKDKGLPYLADSLRRPVEDSRLIALDEIRWFESKQEPYDSFFLGDILDLRGNQRISREEAATLLGYDFKTAANVLLPS
jgi:hypothetical protein